MRQSRSVHSKDAGCPACCQFGDARSAKLRFRIDTGQCVKHAAFSNCRSAVTGDIATQYRRSVGDTGDCGCRYDGGCTGGLCHIDRLTQQFNMSGSRCARQIHVKVEVHNSVSHRANGQPALITGWSKQTRQVGGRRNHDAQLI